MHAERVNPLFLVMVRRRSHQHRVGDHAGLAEDDQEAVRTSRFLQNAVPDYSLKVKF